MMGIISNTPLSPTPHQSPPVLEPLQTQQDTAAAGRDLLSKLFLQPGDVATNLQSPNSHTAVESALSNLSIGGKGRSKKPSKAAARAPPQQKVLELRSGFDWAHPPQGWSEAVERTYQDIVPDQREQQRRQRVLEEIRQAVESCKKGNPPCRLEVYGSFVSGMWTLHSDLDLTVLPTVGMDSKGWSTDIARSCINRFHQTLKRKGLTSFELSQLRLRARVPLAVFEHRNSGVSCDLSFNNTTGIFKAHFLHGIKRIDPRFCKLYMLVKAWARAQGLNDSSEGTFNSWCLAMLVIFYLQTRQSPAILPPIRELFDSRDQAQELGQHPDNHPLLARHRELVDRHIGYGKQNTSNLGQLFLGFLDCMGALVETWLSTQCQVSQGRVNVWDAMFCSGCWAREYRASVEDPFDPTDNCARTITIDGLPMLKQAMNSTKQALQHLQSTGNVDITMSMLFTRRPPPQREAFNNLNDIFAPPPPVTNSLPSLNSSDPGKAILAALTGLARKPVNPPQQSQPPLLQSLFSHDHHLLHQASTQPSFLNHISAPPPVSQPNSFTWGLPNPDSMTPARHPPLPPQAISIADLEAQQLQQHVQSMLLQQEQEQQAQAQAAARLAAASFPPGFAPAHYQPSPMPIGWSPAGFTPQYPIAMNNS